MLNVQNYVNPLLSSPVEKRWNEQDHESIYFVIMFFFFVFFSLLEKKVYFHGFLCLNNKLLAI